MGGKFTRARVHVRIVKNYCTTWENISTFSSGNLLKSDPRREEGKSGSFDFSKNVENFPIVLHYGPPEKIETCHPWVNAYVSRILKSKNIIKIILFNWGFSN